MEEGGTSQTLARRRKKKNVIIIQQSFLFLFKIVKANVLSLCHIQLKRQTDDEKIYGMM